MQTLIDKIKFLVADTNIPTVGYKTMLVVLENQAAGAANFEGTAEEAATLKAGITVNMSDNADGSDPVALDAQYIKVRTVAGSVHAIAEFVLTKAYVASLSLPADYDTLSEFMTLPSNSEV